MLQGIVTWENRYTGQHIHWRASVKEMWPVRSTNVNTLIRTKEQTILQYNLVRKINKFKELTRALNQLFLFGGAISLCGWQKEKIDHPNKEVEEDLVVRLYEGYEKQSEVISPNSWRYVDLTEQRKGFPCFVLR